MSKIIYPNDDGSLSIIFPSLDSGLTIEEIAKKDVPSEKPYLIVKDSDLPDTDLTFADAWEADFTSSKKTQITVNIDKAKEIWRDRLRVARKRKLEKLDVDYIRMMEQGLDTKRIVAEKQKLRDVTNHPQLLNAKTIQDIMSFWPEILI